MTFKVPASCYHYELVLVNHAFYNMFIACLYRDIRINSDDHFRQLLRSSKYHPFVQHMNAYQASLSNQDCLKIQELFPTLLSISLSLSSVCDIPRFYQSFENLSSLCLSTYALDYEPLEIISYTPQLTVLRIEYVPGLNTTTEFVEAVLQRCPKLESLSIASDTADIPFKNAEPITEPNRILKHFELITISELGQHRSWLAYIGHKYPQLQSVQFRQTKQLITIGKSCSKEFYQTFLSQCPHLVRFEWVNVLPDGELVQLLSQQQQTLSVLALNDIPAVVLSQTRHHPFHNILKFYLVQQARGATDEYMNAISLAFPRLSHLTLKPEYLLSPLLNLNRLMKACPNLTVLSLCSQSIECSDFEAEQFPLTQLTLFKCQYDWRLFEYLDATCPDLRYLIVNQPDYSGGVCRANIQLPHRKLTKIEFRVNVRPYRLYQVQQRDRCEWYLLDKYTSDEEIQFVSVHSIKKLSYEEGLLLDNLSMNIPVSDIALLKLPPFYSIYRNLRHMLEKGYVKIVCHSIGAFFINEKRVF
ncbi:hypothetical protein BD560DRAFT_420464 [Blakeslea trispora]|nr:hypothetical protein BD560DRAFT_420464 [Blakeslea trispora]